MAEFKEFNATNEEHTCLWCGQKLVRRFVYETSPEPPSEYYGHRVIEVISSKEPSMTRDKEIGWEHKLWLGTYGCYGNDYFCSLRCGFQFGVQLAEWDNRLGTSDLKFEGKDMEQKNNE